MAIRIDVKVTPLKETYVLSGPIGVRISLMNLTEQDLLFDFFYPEPLGLEFIPGSNQGVSMRERPPILHRTSVAVRVGRGGTMEITHYLNRYLVFTRPGQYRIRYVLPVTVGEPTSDGQLDIPTLVEIPTEGEFTIKLEAAPEEGMVGREIESVAKGLSSADRQKRREAMEALSFLDSPLVIPYLEKALSVDGLEMATIEALGRQQGKQAEDLIRRALTNPQFAVVEDALNELERRKAHVDPEQLRALLNSTNPGIRYVVAQYVIRTGTASHVPLLEILTKDENIEVVRIANEGIKKLSGTK